jgi:uncharacterized repeat protein (TIGR03803 family)
MNSFRPLARALVAAQTSVPTITRLFSFPCNASDVWEKGYSPISLIERADGNLYGAAAAGGTGMNAQGTIFKITPEGHLPVIYNFAENPDGSLPNGCAPGSLVEATDGFLYGTTAKEKYSVALPAPGEGAFRALAPHRGFPRTRHRLVEVKSRVPERPMLAGHPAPSARRTAGPPAAYPPGPRPEVIVCSVHFARPWSAAVYQYQSYTGRSVQDRTCQGTCRADSFPRRKAPLRITRRPV